MMQPCRSRNIFILVMSGDEILEGLAMRKAEVITILLTVITVSMASADETGVDTRTFKSLVKPVLQKYCVGCHGPEKQKARLRYDGMDGFRVSDRHLWTKIHKQLSAG